jgi:hypothetical protein
MPQLSPIGPAPMIITSNVVFIIRYVEDKENYKKGKIMRRG